MTNCHVVSLKYKINTIENILNKSILNKDLKLEYIPWYSQQHDILLIPCYYCPKATGTLISTTDIVFSHLDKFIGWQMTTNVDTSLGTFILLAHDGVVNHVTYPTHMKNNL